MHLGGGVLIACSPLLNTSTLSLPFDSLESVWTIVKLQNLAIYIGAVYIPPDLRSSEEVLDDLHESVSFVAGKLKPNDVMVLLGDFNSPSLSWQPSTSCVNHFVAFACSN